MTKLSIDIETFSEIDIKKAGLHKYVQSPDFQILLFAYAFDDQPTKIVDLAQGGQLPDEVINALQDPFVTKHAYNAAFEHYAINRFYRSPLAQWRCTMLHGSYCGYPLGLDAITKALQLPKDKRKKSTGKSLIKIFCSPCKPTRTNGYRTRTLPHHEPEKWDLFKEYCIGDVDAERAVAEKLAAFTVPGQEEKLWQLDQQINGYGAMVDRDLISGALYCDNTVTDELTEEAINLTNLNNPNSTKQLSEWLESRTGEEVDNLQKATVIDMIESTKDDTVRRMLEIRQELSKTSTKKYSAMDTAVCEDGRIRGLLQFYGANRTGRWAGRLVQIQNLPRNYLETLEHARNCVIHKKLEALKIVYGNVPDTLSQLIRTAFIPAPGNLLVVADYSAIEARVIAWLAGEQWVLDIFKSHGKIYEAAASQMFGVPIEKIVKGKPEYDLRAKGKVAVLACIAEGGLVLTDRGLVPIEKVTTAMRVWDGVEFVRHDGVIYKGIKEVITYDGLTATADHLVWVEGESRPIRFDESTSRGTRLLRSGDGRKTIRVGIHHKPREKMEKRVERPLRTNQMRRMRKHSMDALLQSERRKIKRVSAMFTTSKNPEMVGQKVDCGKAAMYKSKRPKLRQLRRKGYRIPLQLSNRSGVMDYRKSGPTPKKFRAGSNKQRWALRSGKPSFCPKTSKYRKQEIDSSPRMEPRKVALRAKCGYQKIIFGNDQSTNNRRSRTGCQRQTQELARHRSKVKVYDILNCGPRHRYTVNDVLVHNCGYQGGVGALLAMGADKMGLSDADLKEIVTRWRQSNRRIVDFWYALDRAVVSVIKTGQPVGVRGLIIAHESDYDSKLDFLTIRLPSGRKLYYPKPFLALNAFDREAMHYWGVNQTSKKWEAISTYGGRLAENVTQAIARDCLAESLVRVVNAGYQTVFHVHDEVVIDAPMQYADPDRVCEIMSQPISWAPGLPLKAAGFVTNFYMKD